MEIERKYLTKELPAHLDSYPHDEIEQAYLCTSPVMRIRRQGDIYLFTYKGSGLMAREEYNLPLNADAFAHLLPKTDGRIIRKTRYRIPYTCGGLDLTIELDIFQSPSDLIMAEVEFPDEESAKQFIPPAWFDCEVTHDPKYHNSNMVIPGSKSHV